MVTHSIDFIQFGGYSVLLIQFKQTNGGLRVTHRQEKKKRKEKRREEKRREEKRREEKIKNDTPVHYAKT